MKFNKALLCYGYTRKNAGDMAITLGAIDLLLSMNMNLTIVCRYHESAPIFRDTQSYLKQIYGDSVRLISCPFRLERDQSFFHQAYNYAYSVLVYTRILKPKAFYQALHETDVIFFNGGNLLRSKSLSDLLRLKALSFPFKISSKPYFLLPQSSSSIDRHGRGVVQYLLRNSNENFIRESKSVIQLKDQFPDLSIRKSLDLAFFIDRKSDADGLVPERFIGLTVRGWSVGDITPLSYEKISIIKKALLTIASTYDSTERDFLLVCQTEKDLQLTKVVAQLISENLSSKVSVLECYDPLRLKAIYRRADLLIGMRLHSIILALSVGTPVVGAFYSEWGLKNPGIMDDFKMPYTILDDIEKSTSEALSIEELTERAKLGLKHINFYKQELINIINT